MIEVRRGRKGQATQRVRPAVRLHTLTLYPMPRVPPPSTYRNCLTGKATPQTVTLSTLRCNETITEKLSAVRLQGRRSSSRHRVRQLEKRTVLAPATLWITYRR